MDAFDARCIVTKVLGADALGRAVLGESREEQCVVLKLFEHEGPLADGIRHAPDYPASPDQVADAVLLLRTTTNATVADMVEIGGVKLRVIGVSSSYDGVGKLSRYVVEATRWE